MGESRLEQLIKFRDSRPDDPFLPYAIALEYVNLGDDDRAIPYFEELLERFAAYVPTYLHYGMLLERKEELDSAKRIFDAGIVTAQAAGDGHALSELRAARAGID